MMDPRIPPILHPLLADTTCLIEQEIPGRITGFYLEGSLALDSFNPRLSDIDFVAILSSQATSEDYKLQAALPGEIRTSKPLRLVLDRKPFI